MTIDEKRNRLEYYCEHQNDCHFCKISYEMMDKGKVCDDYFRDDDFIEKVYSKIYGEQNIQREEINHPDRYAGGKFECINVMLDVFGADAVKHFCILNAFKYIWRAEKKNGVEDIKKAVWYLNKFIELGGVDGESKTG